MMIAYERQFLKTLQGGIENVLPDAIPDFQSHDQSQKALLGRLVNGEISDPVFFTQVELKDSSWEKNTQTYTLLENGVSKDVSVDLRKAIPFRMQLEVHVITQTRDEAVAAKNYLTNTFQEPQTLSIEHPYNFDADVCFSAVCAADKEVLQRRKDVSWSRTGTVYEIVVFVNLCHCVLFPQAVKEYEYSADRGVQILTLKLISQMDQAVKSVRKHFCEHFHEYDEDGDMINCRYREYNIAQAMFDRPTLADAPTPPADYAHGDSAQAFAEVQQVFHAFRETDEYHRMIDEQYREAADNMFDLFGQIPPERRNVELRTKTDIILQKFRSSDNSLEEVIEDVVTAREVFSHNLREASRELEEEERRREQELYEAEIARREERRARLEEWEASRNLYASPLCQMGKRNPRTGKVVWRCIQCELWARCNGQP